MNNTVSIDKELKELRVKALIRLTEKLNLFTSEDWVRDLADKYTDAEIMKMIRKVNNKNIRYITKRLIRYLFK